MAHIFICLTREVVIRLFFLQPGNEVSKAHHPNPGIFYFNILLSYKQRKLFWAKALSCALSDSNTLTRLRKGTVTCAPAAALLFLLEVIGTSSRSSNWEEKRRVL